VLCGVWVVLARFELCATTCARQLDTGHQTRERHQQQRESSALAPRGNAGAFSSFATARFGQHAARGSVASLSRSSSLSLLLALDTAISSLPLAPRHAALALSSFSLARPQPRLRRSGLAVSPSLALSLSLARSLSQMMAEDTGPDKPIAVKNLCRVIFELASGTRSPRLAPPRLEEQEPNSLGGAAQTRLCSLASCSRTTSTCPRPRPLCWVRWSARTSFPPPCLPVALSVRSSVRRSFACSSLINTTRTGFLVVGTAHAASPRLARPPRRRSHAWPTSTLRESVGTARARLLTCLLAAWWWWWWSWWWSWLQAVHVCVQVGAVPPQDRLSPGAGRLVRELEQQEKEGQGASSTGRAGARRSHVTGAHHHVLA